MLFYVMIVLDYGFVQIPTLPVFTLDHLTTKDVFPVFSSSEDEDHMCVSNVSLPDGTHL